jgi:hypothetical protein
VSLALPWITARQRPVAKQIQKNESPYVCKTSGVKKKMIQPFSFQRVSDDPAQLRLKAEACRRLADLTKDAEHEALWQKRANEWEQLATRAEKRRPKSTRSLGCRRGRTKACGRAINPIEY